MYSEMHIWHYNIKNYYMKQSQDWGVHRFQIDGQAFTLSYVSEVVIKHLWGVKTSFIFHKKNTKRPFHLKVEMVTLLFII